MAVAEVDEAVVVDAGEFQRGNAFLSESKTFPKNLAIPDEPIETSKRVLEPIERISGVLFGLILWSLP